MVMMENEAIENRQDSETETEKAKMEEFRRFLQESKYTPLYLHLKSIPHERSGVTLSIKELEDILGVSLPSTARKARSWWANSFYNERAIFWMIAGWKVDSFDAQSEAVTFVRDAKVIERASVNRGNWGKLTRFFKSLPPKQQQIALTFDEIGKHRGMPLPPTAFHDRPWWANTKSPQGQAWMSAGWVLENVYLNSKIAVFRRKDKHLREIRDFVRKILEGSHIRSQPCTATLKNWVSMCRRLGWYFEATVIYERGGLRTDLIQESERQELEYDYEVSKRELNTYNDPDLRVPSETDVREG